MKRKIYHISIFLLFWICEAAYSQNPEADVLRQDLSGLFKDLSMTGVLGEDCSRIDIHFSEARKMDNREYGISGVSRTRLSAICPFEGKVCIDSISSVPQMESECTAVDGFIYGHYSFVEYGDKRCSGVFSGSFKQGYRMNGQRAEKGRNEITELRLNLSEYRGKWKAANGLAKVCSWADEIIPDTPTDFCQFNDAGEWVVSPQYRKNGWDNLYNAYHNENLTTDKVQKARAVEEQEWWADSVTASPLSQDTIRDEAYQLYPLGIACRNGDMETIKRLLAGKDEPMAMGNDCYEFDILYTAIFFDKEDVLEYALTRYKDINNRVYSDEYGLTLLTYACKLSNAKLARILLEHGINVNGCQSPYDTYKVYPIMEAIANNNIELVQLLLEYHADLDIKDSNGSTPLDLAKETGAKEIEDLLLQYMNNKNNANNAG